ncbi:ferredoxin-NADP reductase [Microbacterium terrae]|uniref:Ferredoxin--NAD(P)(+) reductase (Naphthalene dioxygenase/salicylate 5-hydroxylase ferredoxin-specific) n=1 Tax=Microbacterium terrae TaxID=69369 RepID=A0A0M2GWA7_9MICO|nr:FAD-binding oxidoreductase [Microbacterium terrae]KJL38024.1 Ferredoxin--NAD(P)(+) reductase (naphthalene dioxygenase/salicylate 5-hydroxylase ferredoxin-specific) [Microbacterium terrae]MBP1077436.1 ferredoxin-NADP reductase [Microbacterium terrae]GLJ99043.1 oxidoreductase [Microbacterium terrae]
MSVGGWRPARISSATAATSTARVLRVAIDDWPGSRPGQHVDVRLTAEDGYQAVRSYSLGSYGAAHEIELAIDEVPDGEVSPYLVHDAQPGDELEIKGPLGGYFVWEPGGAEPVQLIAGGSGIVPLMAMARAATDAGAAASVRLLYSVRRPEDAIYRDELDGWVGRGGVGTTWAYTRGGPDGWPGSVGRLDAERIAAAAWPADRAPIVFVCGSTGFVETVADALVALGHDPSRIRTERFGGA